MKNIRHHVFETNSSSTHSFSISSKVDGMLDTIPVSDDGTITLEGGEFGWNWEKFTDALSKANYAAQYAMEGFDSQNSNNNMLNMLMEVLMEHTGAKKIVFNTKEGYIDHQSAYCENGEAEIFKNKEVLKNFLFNPRSAVFTGNDNEDEPPNFTDDEDTVYTHVFTMKDYTMKLKEVPDADELRDIVKTAARNFSLADYPLPKDIYNYDPEKDEAPTHEEMNAYYAAKDLHDESIYQFCQPWGDTDKADSMANIDKGYVTFFQEKRDYSDRNKVKVTYGKSIDVPFTVEKL